MVNIEQKDNTLNISYINSEGKIEFYPIKIPNEEMFEWKYCERYDKPDKTFKSWDNKPIKKVKKNYLNKYRIQELLYQQPKRVQDIIFQFNVPKMCFCDIETEVIDGLPDYNNPIPKILTIAMCNEKENIIVLGLKDFSDFDSKDVNEQLNKYFEKYNRKITFKYIKFDDEYTMLHTFLSKYVREFPLLTGWNFVQFDWLYIIHRAKKLQIDANICSVSNKLYGQDLIPQHKIIIDYLKLYSSYDHVIDIKEGLGLDVVANAVLGLRKIKYQGTLNDLYIKDYRKYVFYNAVDAYLVRLIHEKINTLVPFLKLSQISNSEILKSYGSVHLVEMLMLPELLRRNKVFIAKDYDENRTQITEEKFKGAYVKEPKPGLFSNLVTFDYSSLYPTTIRQWNMSPDVYLGKNLSEVTDDMIVAITGATFKKNEDGVLRVVLTDLFNKRDKAKQNKSLIEREINELKKLLKTKI